VRVGGGKGREGAMGEVEGEEDGLDEGVEEVEEERVGVRRERVELLLAVDLHTSSSARLGKDKRA